MVPLPSTSAWKANNYDLNIKRSSKVVIAQYHAVLKIPSTSTAPSIHTDTILFENKGNQ